MRTCLDCRTFGAMHVDTCAYDEHSPAIFTSSDLKGMEMLCVQ